MLQAERLPAAAVSEVGLEVAVRRRYADKALVAAMHLELHHVYA